MARISRGHSFHQLSAAAVDFSVCSSSVRVYCCGGHDCTAVRPAVIITPSHIFNQALSSKSFLLHLQLKYFKGSFQDPTQFFSIPLMNAVARELSQSYARSAAAATRTPAAAANTVIQWQPRMAKFPHPSLQTTSLLGQVLSSFVFASLMFGFVTQVGRKIWARVTTTCRSDLWHRPPVEFAAACGVGMWAKEIRRFTVVL